MQNNNSRGKMFARAFHIRRFVFYLAAILISFYLFNKTRRSSLGSIEFTTPYNEYIDQNGNFLPYSGYKILQFASNFASQKNLELYHFLDQRSDFKTYFKLIPPHAYHITLTNLKNKTVYTSNDLKVLKEEQELLDKDVIPLRCSGKQLLIINKKEIRLEIELSDSNYTKDFQKRWSDKFPELIVEHYTTFYVTIAYQYKDIPTGDTLYQLQVALKEWKSLPIEIDLDPPEICSYKDVISYTVLIPDSA